MTSSHFHQISVLLQSLTCSMDSDSGFCSTWFKSNFVMSHGPIAIAILAWQNSIVFHSLDKMTSYFIHIMPVTLKLDGSANLYFLIAVILV